MIYQNCLKILLAKKPVKLRITLVDKHLTRGMYAKYHYKSWYHLYKEVYYVSVLNFYIEAWELP